MGYMYVLGMIKLSHMQFFGPAVLFEAKSSYFNMPAFVILVFSLSSNGSLLSFLCFELLSSEALDSKSKQQM